jgi:putative nucleotidyltransferase with HDIG domain
MIALYEGSKSNRIFVAARHSRSSRALMGLLVSLAFGTLFAVDRRRMDGWALAWSLLWLAEGTALGVSFRALARRSLLTRSLTLAYVMDTAYAAGLVWIMGASPWLLGLALMTVTAMAGLYLNERGIRVVMACTAAAALLVLASPRLGALAPPPAAPYPVPAGGVLGLVSDATVVCLLALVAWSYLRFGRENSLREHEMQQANQRLRALNEALSDQQFSLRVSQQDLMLSNERLRLKNEEVLKSQDVIRTLAQALEARDVYTQGHSSRVAELAVMLARGLGLSREEQDTVRLGCLLHDIGKIHVPDAVLRKTSSLSEEEFILMRKHPAIGEQICRPLVFARPFLSIVRHHHERIDGRGYPDGLKGEEISLHARIAAIADAWDAMTSDRPYRAALGTEVAMERLREGAGTQWDAELAEIFMRIMRSQIDAGIDASSL